MDQEARQRKLQALWLHVTNMIKKQIVNPTLWMAMEATKPLTVEGNVIILGIEGHQFYLASNLEQQAYRTAIEKDMSAAAGAELHYRLIQGESIDDWEEIKERERMAEEMKQMASSSQRAAPPAQREAGTAPVQQAAPTGAPAQPEPSPVVAADSWEEVLTQVHRAFLALRVKTIPQGRAQYILNVMPMIAAAEARLRVSPEAALEDRGLAHVLDKIAQLAETDSTIVALEYLRYKQSQNQPANTPDTGAS